jgi:hypothetical protein
MAEITNTTLLQDLQSIAKLRAGDIGKFKLSKTIVPVLETNSILSKPCNIVRHASQDNGTSSTIYTTPSDMDFYLVAASVSVAKDGTSPSTATKITIVTEGASRDLLVIRGLASTVEHESLSISFPNPIKIDRNTVINVTNGSGTATIRAEGSIMGFTL